VRPDRLKGSWRVAAAGLLITAIALVDWRVEVNIAFGFLYIFPMLLLGTVLPRWQVILTALLCAFLADFFDPFAFTLAVALPQDVLVFSALAGAGLFSSEITRSRRSQMESLHQLETEVSARREAEEQLEFLFESSPAAILIMSDDYRILRANSAAHRLFEATPGSLPGRSIGGYLPALSHVPLVDETSQRFRTEMQCRGERESSEVFMANVFFSTYDTTAGTRLAAMVVDASEEIREREESALEQLMASSRILVGAVSHEVRNVCSAISVIRENLARNARWEGNKDFEALGSLIEALNKIASLELKQTSGESQMESLDLHETLRDLRIVLDPYCQQAGVSVFWTIPEEHLIVVADRHKLLQVLLNLAKNSARALEAAEDKRLNISVSAKEKTVSLRVADSGPGIASVEKLFQPFQVGAASTGIGLYLSRALLRSFGGDLRYDPAAPGCTFVIDLATANSHQLT
jgi:two-component system, LuxR family, sensor kinase FixL